MIRNFLWDMAGKFGAQAISLLLSFALTRMLSPGEFGIAGIAMVIIFVSSVFLDMGFARALVQAKEVRQAGYSSVFFLNLLLGIFLMAVCFFAATPLASFYNQPQLEPVLRVLSLLFLINSFALVPGAVLSREMKFKWIAIAGLISAVVSGSISIVMAAKGYGVWSLVTQYLISAVLMAILTFYFARWSPAFIISKKALQPLWAYGSRMFSSTILSSIVTRLDVFIIGKLFNVTTLGYYTRSQSIDSAVRQFSSGSLISVFFPSAARLQDKREQLTILYKRFLHLVSFLSIGVSGLLYLITPDLFRILFTAKWDTAAIYFQIMCIAAFAWPISALMVTLISGTGNSKAYLRLELLRIAIQLPVYIFGFIAGITTFLWIFVGVRVISLCLNALFVSREIQIRTGEQLLIILYYLIHGIIAGLLTSLISHYFLTGSRVINMGLTIFLFCFFFIITQFLAKTEAFREIVSLSRRLKIKQQASL